MEASPVCVRNCWKHYGRSSSRPSLRFVGLGPPQPKLKARKCLADAGSRRAAQRAREVQELRTALRRLLGEKLGDRVFASLLEFDHRDLSKKLNKIPRIFSNIVTACAAWRCTSIFSFYYITVPHIKTTSRSALLTLGL